MNWVASYPLHGIHSFLQNTKMNEEPELEEFAPWLAIVITLIGGFLRALFLGSKGMWLDETFSVWLANHSIPDMLQWIVRIDQHPPLYYLLLQSWIARHGDTPYYARLLSALLGAGTIPIIYLIGKRLSGAVVGLAAAVFLAFSPFNIFYAQETRMYTLLAFNAAVAMYALVRLLTDSRSVMPIGSQVRDALRLQNPNGSSAIGMRPAIELDGEPGSSVIAGPLSRRLRLTWHGLPLSCSRLRLCLPTIRLSFSCSPPIYSSLA
jgi:dolichyl-phosphate-mannose-protein mannosyltransferase